MRGQHHAGTKNARGPTGLIAGSVVAGLLILVVVVFILTVG